MGNFEQIFHIAGVLIVSYDPVFTQWRSSLHPIIEFFFVLNNEYIDPLLSVVSFLYPWKSSEKWRFSVFRAWKKGAPGSNGFEQRSKYIILTQ